MSVNWKALWAAAAFVVAVLVATGHGELGVGLVIAAVVVLELLTWAGAMGLGGGRRG